MTFSSKVIWTHTHTAVCSSWPTKCPLSGVKNEGGGRLAGVEVARDGRTRWHAAETQTNDGARH